MFTEPHSTKQIEDSSAGGSRRRRRRSIATTLERRARRGSDARRSPRACRCPVLVIHGHQGRDHRPRPGRRSPRDRRRARHARGLGPRAARPRPVKVNLLLRDFVAPAAAAAPAGRAAGRAASARSTSRRRSASAMPSATSRSPTSCAGSSRPRDRLARAAPGDDGARGARRAHPPGERACWPTSRGHIESESAEHDLHCFQAIRRMDEILLANFMVFHDLVREEQYDLWIGDEAWELDYYLHENPEQKRAAYVWLTDFVGWLPMPDGGEHEAFLTADYNAEMIEHIARYPRAPRPGDLRRQPRRHRARRVRAGPAADPRLDRAALRLRRLRDRLRPRASSRPRRAARELGYARRRAGLHRHASAARAWAAHLLRRVIDAFPEAKRARARRCGWSSSPGRASTPRRCPQHDGLEIRAYVHDLYRHLAACDLAVVQGGLTTSMELTANRRPFLYFPLRHHFEQNFHVRHRLEPLRRGPLHGLRDGDPERSPRRSPRRSAATSTTGRSRRTAPRARRR